MFDKLDVRRQLSPAGGFRLVVREVDIVLTIPNLCRPPQRHPFLRRHDPGHQLGQK